jgi:hypothetical protein
MFIKCNIIIQARLSSCIAFNKGEMELLSKQMSEVIFIYAYILLHMYASMRVSGIHLVSKLIFIFMMMIELRMFINTLKCLSIYTYICVFIYLCVYMYAYICIRKHHIYTYVYICSNIYVYMYCNMPMYR